VGVASSRGSIQTRTPAVGTETAAVTAFRLPDSQHIGCQTVHTSMKCVSPQATMNSENSANSGGNGSSLRRRRSSRASENGIDRYASPTSRSLPTCSHSSAGIQV